MVHSLMFSDVKSVCEITIVYPPFFDCFQPPNNVVRYTITEDQEDLECFLINEVTGQLLLRRSLLYDPCRANAFLVSNTQKPQYSGLRGLTVLVKDGNP